MKQTAVEWLEMQLGSKIADASIRISAPKFFELINQAKEMEKKETLKRQLFIGKVSEIIGFKKTLELWKETLNEIK